MTAMTDAATPSERATPRFPGLDSLRAIAAIAVVGTHTSFWAGTYGHGTLGAATQRLESGVAIFFVLSGFLLSYPYLASVHSGRRHDGLGRYFWKRALRILPVYWVTVVAALVLLKENRDLPASRWIDNFLLIDLFRSDALPFGLTQMWSLTMEAAFYVSLPLLMWALLMAASRRSWHPDRLLLGCAVMGLTTVLWISFGSASVDFAHTGVGTNRWLIAYLLWFALGIGLAIVSLDVTTGRSGLTRPLRVLASSPASCWAAALALYAIVSTPIGGSTGLVVLAPHESVTRNVFYGCIAALVVLPSVLGDPESPYARVLARQSFRHLGHISYSLFCCHVIVLELVSVWTGYELFRGHAISLFVITLGISVVVAELLYRLVELPFSRLKNFRSRTKPPIKAPSANNTRS